MVVVDLFIIMIQIAMINRVIKTATDGIVDEDSILQFGDQAPTHLNALLVVSIVQAVLVL